MSWIVDYLRAALTAPVSDAARRIAARSIADTIAVAAAGYCTSSVDILSRAYEADVSATARSWNGMPRADGEIAAFVDATAAHALDFDDLDPASSAHLSCVVIPLLFAEAPRLSEQVLLDAVAAASMAAGALGTWVGPDHYRRGWHATATIGTLAACLALARARALMPEIAAQAIGLAATQLGGIQASFGSDAKSLHAGFAAVSAHRSVRLAELGLMGNPNALDHPTFLSIYGGGQPAPQAPLASMPLIKLYPCCFALHRAIAATLSARSALGDAWRNADARYMLTLPGNTRAILFFGTPQTPTEAAFSAAYCCAAALIDGDVTIAHFAENFGDPRIREIAAKFFVTIAPDEHVGSDIFAGKAILTVAGLDGQRQRFRQIEMPGSGNDDELDLAIGRKTSACLARYEARSGHPFPALDAARAFPSIARFLN